jgi:PHD/YefM family antitoxin component YafN of YafNO toxin-antitoxin module
MQLQTSLLEPRPISAKVEFDSLKTFSWITLMNINRDIHSLTEFKLHTPEFVQQLKETGEPLVLTINGKAELVVQDAASYQKLLDIAEEAKVLEGIRRGLEDMKAGRTQPLEAALADIRRDLQLPHGS